MKKLTSRKKLRLHKEKKERRKIKGKKNAMENMKKVLIHTYRIIK